MENSMEEQKKRPVFLTVLAILSFISIGFGLLGNVMGLIAGPMSAAEMEQVTSTSMKIIESMDQGGANNFSDTFAMAFRMENYKNLNFYPDKLITILGFVLGLFGVINMMKGNKNGFHMYIIYNLISIATIYVSVPPSEVPGFFIVVNVLFSGLFVLLYSRNLHWMK
jgi:hypothetical protein